jgi:hypothetical protein
VTKKKLKFCFHDDEGVIETWLFAARDKKIQVRFQGRQYALLRGGKGTYFSLRKESEFGEDVFSIRYFKSSANDSRRSCFCRLPATSGTLPDQLEARGASLDSATVESVKNMVLSSATGEAFVTVRKWGKNMLDLIAREDLPSVCVLVIGVSAFLCAPLSQLGPL